MAVDDVYETTTFFDFQDNPNVYIFHLREDGGGAGVPEDEINNYFEAVVLPAIAIFTTDKLKFVCIETRRILINDQKDPVSSLPRQNVVDINGMKASPLEPLPGQCSLVIQLLNDIENLDPKRRGRDFWTGLLEADQDNGTWLQAAADAITGAMNAAFLQPFATVGGATYLWGVYSQTLAAQRKAQPDGTPVPNLIDPFSLIRDMRPLQQVRTQRRRQPDNPCKLYYPVVSSPP